MPHRLNEFRAKIQFITFAEMPSMIYRAVLRTDKVSNTQYIQHAVCAALSRDLGIPLEELLVRLPEPRGSARVPFGEDRRPRKGPSGGVEEVV